MATLWPLFLRNASVRCRYGPALGPVKGRRSRSMKSQNAKQALQVLDGPEYPPPDMSALDELLSQWRSNPDADATIALCSFLGNSSREELIREVSASADTWHAEDGRVMLAVGRMHLDAGLLAEAQGAFVAAGKANGRDPQPFRFLGEVLLRRGDALRAEKVLARALQFDPNDGEARLWHDRSVVYSALQKRIGVQAVAAEVLRTMPRQNSIPPPTVQGLSNKKNKPFGNEELTKPRAQNPLAFEANVAVSPAE